MEKHRPVALSELKYDPGRVAEVALRRVGKLRPQPIGLRQAYGDVGMDFGVHSTAQGPGERVVGTLQAKARGVDVRTAKQGMKVGCDLGAIGDAHDRPKQISVALGANVRVQSADTRAAIVAAEIAAYAKVLGEEPACGDIPAVQVEAVNVMSKGYVSVLVAGEEVELGVVLRGGETAKYQQYGCD